MLGRWLFPGSILSKYEEEEVEEYWKTRALDHPPTLDMHINTIPSRTRRRGRALIYFIYSSEGQRLIQSAALLSSCDDLLCVYLAPVPAAPRDFGKNRRFDFPNYG